MQFCLRRVLVDACVFRHHREDTAGLLHQYGAAHNGQIHIGTHKIVREGPDEVQQLLKDAAVVLHRHVPGIEDDEVLVVIHIGAVLRAPEFSPQTLTGTIR